MTRKKPSFKTLFGAELRYQFTSPVRILAKCSGVFFGTLLLMTQLIFQKEASAILTTSVISIVATILGVVISSLIQNLQSVDRLKTQFLIYRSKQVVITRFMNEVINVVASTLMIFIIIAIALAIKLNAETLSQALTLVTKSLFPLISFGILIAYLGSWAATIKANVKIRKAVGIITALIVYALVLILGILMASLANWNHFLKSQDWILALPFLGTFLANTFIFTSGITWIYAGLTLGYVALLIGLTFRFYSRRIKLSITQE